MADLSVCSSSSGSGVDNAGGGGGGWRALAGNLVAASETVVPTKIRALVKELRDWVKWFGLAVH